MEHGKIYDFANPNSRMLFWAVKMGPCQKYRESEQTLRLKQLLQSTVGGFDLLVVNYPRGALVGEYGAVVIVIGIAHEDKAAGPRVPGVNARRVLTLCGFDDPVVPWV